MFNIRFNSHSILLNEQNCVALDSRRRRGTRRRVGKIELFQLRIFLGFNMHVNYRLVAVVGFLSPFRARLCLPCLASTLGHFGRCVAQSGTHRRSFRGAVLVEHSGSRTVPLPNRLQRRHDYDKWLPSGELNAEAQSTAPEGFASISNPRGMQKCID